MSHIDDKQNTIKFIIVIIFKRLLSIHICSTFSITHFPHPQCLNRATIAFSQRYVLKINNLSFQKCGKRVQTITKVCRTAYISHGAFSWIWLFRRCQEHSDRGFSFICLCVTLLYSSHSQFPSQSVPRPLKRVSSLEELNVSAQRRKPTKCY